MKEPIRPKSLTIDGETPGASPGVSLGDLARYGQLIETLLDRIHMANSLQPGESTEAGVLQLNIKGKEFDWNLGTIKRMR
jgi:hypothetical protein